MNDTQHHTVTKVMINCQFSIFENKREGMKTYFFPGNQRRKELCFPFVFIEKSALLTEAACTIFQQDKMREICYNLILISLELWFI